MLFNNQVIMLNPPSFEIASKISVLKSKKQKKLIVVFLLIPLKLLSMID